MRGMRANLGPALRFVEKPELSQAIKEELDLSIDSNSVNFEQPLRRQLFSYHPGLTGIGSKETTVEDGIENSQSSQSVFSTDEKEKG